MAKAQSSSKSWTRLACDVAQALLVGPAEVALAWRGAKATSCVDIRFFRWHDMPDVMDALPADLKPRAGKKANEPVLTASSADEAEELVRRLVAFLKTKRPEATDEEQWVPANDPDGLVTSVTIGDSDKWLIRSAADPADVALGAGKGKQVWTQPIGAHTGLFWRAMLFQTVYIRVDRDGFTVVDTTTDSREVEDVLRSTTPTKHGTWTFDSGIAVAMWAPLAIADLDGLQAAKAIDDLAALVETKPLVVANANGKETTKFTAADGAILKLAPGAYVANTGGDKTTRWLRFQRA
jgi:hypothetical protein